MIKSLTVQNTAGDTLVLELTNPERSGFVVRSITGLGPVSASISTNDISSGDGSVYSSSRLSSRRIEIELQYLDNLMSIESARQYLYSYFEPKKVVTLTIETDNRLLQTHGIVESDESTIFSEAETASIAIFCPDPYLYSPFTDVLKFFSVDDKFEFPFENNNLRDNLIEFGEIDTSTSSNFYYAGESNTGCVVSIFLYGPVKNIKIYELINNITVSIDTSYITKVLGSALKYGDRIIISSVQGDKKCEVIRDRVHYNVLNSLGRNTKWITLSSGDNFFQYEAESGSENMKISIEVNTRFIGI